MDGENGNGLILLKKISQFFQVPKQCLEKKCQKLFMGCFPGPAKIHLSSLIVVILHVTGAFYVQVKVLSI